MGLGLAVLGRATSRTRTGRSVAASHLIRRVRNQFRTARLPDANRYWLAAGLGYRWTADLRFDAAYVHIFGGDAPINEVSRTGDLLLGRYSNHVDIVSLSATLRF